MRVHVSAHIVRGDISGHDLCGFCGKEGCKNEVAVTHKSSQKMYKISKSDCAYYFDNGRKKAFGKNNRSTNRLMACKVTGCSSAVWVYNLPKHYEVKHPDLDVPDTISEEERAYLTDHTF